MLTDSINHKKIRFSFTGSLVFCFLLLGCAESRKTDNPVTIQWKDKRAESIIIARKILSGIPPDSIKQLLHVQLDNSNAPILGEYIITDDAITFLPLIAFTRGLNYEVRLSNKLVAGIEIPFDETQTAPKVIAVYPGSDTVPLNLLKIYVAFSKSMQEGQSLNNITVIKDKKDTIPSVFLDLQPELWNKERTILTLWLDPGRIKRDLQPNKAMGSPLQQGAHYELLINKNWGDAEGSPLSDEYRKEFIVDRRDSLSPVIENWTIHPPAPASNQPLRIDLHEALDYVLLKNTVRVIDKNGNPVNGSIETAAKENILLLTPSVAWSSGEYIIEIESRLEDLAGNNLNRLFDTDLDQKRPGVQKEIYKRSFHIP